MMIRSLSAATALVLVVTSVLPPLSAAQVGLQVTLVPAFESLSPEGAMTEARATIDGGLDAEALCRPRTEARGGLARGAGTLLEWIA
jgi:hypothetical protein